MCKAVARGLIEGDIKQCEKQSGKSEEWEVNKKLKFIKLN